MRKHILAAVQKHAAAEYPRECCGLIVAAGRSQRYIPCDNTASDLAEEFRISPEQYAAAEDQGEVIGIVHSHPDATSRPSSRDLAMCEATGLPWHILSWPEGDLRTITPAGETPLLARPFVHGAWDCWQVCADWYQREWGLEFPAYAREDGWWEQAAGPSLYEQAYEAAGFYQVSQPQRGDMIVMAVGRTAHPNHAGTRPRWLSRYRALTPVCTIACSREQETLVPGGRGKSRRLKTCSVLPGLHSGRPLHLKSPVLLWALSLPPWPTSLARYRNLAAYRLVRSLSVVAIPTGNMSVMRTGHRFALPMGEQWASPTPPISTTTGRTPSDSPLSLWFR